MCSMVCFFDSCAPFARLHPVDARRRVRSGEEFLAETVVQFLAESRQEHMFPTLTPAQIARLTAHGTTRTVAAGDVLLDVGEPMNLHFVVTSGRLRAERAS